jgi:hypothetical protein
MDKFCKLLNTEKHVTYIFKKWHIHSYRATYEQINTKMQASEIGIYEFTDKFPTHVTYLKKNVSNIMHQKHQCSYAMEVAHP